MRSFVITFLLAIGSVAIPTPSMAVQVDSLPLYPVESGRQVIAIDNATTPTHDTVEPLIVGGLYSRPPQPRALPPGYEGYHDYAEMVSAITATAIDHAAIVSVFSIGTSYEGKALWAAKISDNVAADEAEPEVVFAFGQHAREILTIEQALYTLNMLTDGYGIDSSITAAVDNNELWILFNLNPDGSEYDKDNGLVLWRKNRQPNADLTVGTDLNRNWAYQWGCCGGSSAVPEDSTYRGAAPFSAPETGAVAAFFASRVVGGEQQIKLFVDWHSYGEYILYPYGYTKTDVPPDMDAVDRDVMVAMATAMGAMNGYTAIQASDLFNQITDGTSDDWAYGTHGVISFTFELSSAGSASGFYPSDSVIATETARNHDAILYLLDNAACPYAVVDRSDLCGGSPPLPPPPPGPDPSGAADTVGYVDATGAWYLLDSAGLPKPAFFYGNPGDSAFMGDWNCDGIDTPGLHRASDGFVYLRNSNTQGIADVSFFFGDPGDVPLAGDFDNDGCDTVSVYRPSIATIFIINQLGANGGGLGAASHSFAFGDLGDRPFAADFDGDGFDTVGIHRNDGFVYYRNDLLQGIAQASFFFGNNDDIFVAGDWDGDGIETPGVFRPQDITFYLRNSNTQGSADEFVQFGVSTAQPVSGSFG